MNTQITSVRLSGVVRPIAIAAMLAAGLSSSALAQSTWTGAIDSQYTEAGNWTPSGRPDTANGATAIINSGDVIYTPGGDLFVNNGGTLLINGGSWTQVDGIAWIKLQGGTIHVAGGTFNQGTSQNIERDAGSAIIVSGGIANLNGNLLHDTTNLGSFTLSGNGTVNVAGEFKPISNFTMSTGTLNANLISFADGPGGILFSGGTISINGQAAFSGLYGGGIDKGINFTTTSLGSLFFDNFTEEGLVASSFMTNGTIQLNGAIDAGAFTITEADGGVYVSLTSNIPEPSSFAALAGLGVLGFVASRRRRAAN